MRVPVGCERATRSTFAPPLVALRRLAVAVAAVVAATAAAEIALAPIGAALFGRVTCAGLLLNLAAIPLMTVVQAGSLAALGAWLLDPDLARACGYVVHVAARGLVDSARLVDLAPWLSRELAPPAWGVLAAYYGALVLSLLPTRVSRAAAVVTALLGLLIVVGTARRHARRRARCRLAAGCGSSFWTSGRAMRRCSCSRTAAPSWSMPADCRPLRSRIRRTVPSSTSASASSRARCARSACVRSTRSC